MTKKRRWPWVSQMLARAGQTSNVRGIYYAYYTLSRHFFYRPNAFALAPNIDESSHTVYNIPTMNGDELNIYNFGIHFEEISHQNGTCYWLDTDLMVLLGYTDYPTFNKVILKAVSSCSGLEIDPFDDFIRYHHTNENGIEGHFKLTRLACFLVTQQADQNKQEVRMLQYCLANMADSLMGHDEIERLEVRGKLSEEEKSLASTAKTHGVINYAYFKDKGYRGMYNMGLAQLKRSKHFFDKRGTLYDRMNTTELAANLFRITQTKERIKTHHIQGQEQLEDAAFQVGRTVRGIVRENTGKNPENLPLEDKEIKELKSEGKKAVKKLRAIDKKPKKK